jgi:hypothetical protein
MRDDGRQIHVINPFRNPLGGSELWALELYRTLRARAGRRVELWTVASPAPALRDRYPIRRIVRWRGQLPRAGTLCVVGAYFRLGRWLRAARPRRIVLHYNTNEPARLAARRAELARWGGADVEVVHCSERLRARAGVSGVVELPILECGTLDRLALPRRARAGSFVVGRHSREARGKHHAEDLDLYRRLAARGCVVRLMGGHPSWRPEGLATGIELAPTGSVEVEPFLAGLDCFLYRTASWWPEPFGRVVVEAMAAGLPVVCHASGGYAEVIRHGENGFLFETGDEAYGIVLRLKDDPALREAVGAAARATARALCSEARKDEVARFYGADA